jgi:hypothetical protein
MSTAAGMPKNHYQLQVSKYDQVSSMLIALLCLIGTVVAMLVIIFLFRRFNPEKAVPELIAINSAPRGERPKGIAEDINPPALQDAPQLNKPDLQETLKELTQALTSNPAMLSDEVFNTEGAASQGPTGLGHKDGTGTGVGGGGNSPPKELRFNPASDADYAAMLDFFGAELAVLDPQTNRIYYAKNLSAAKPTTRNEPYTPPKQFYFLARGAPLQPIEINLARRAGIMKAGATLITLWPDKIAQEIFRMEQERMHAKGRKSLDEIEKTYYRVEKKGREYVISVEDQTYF